MARHVQGPEADLVPAAPLRPRLRHLASRERPPGIRRVALARLLGAARSGDRFQARRLSPGARAARGLPRGGAARDRSLALWPAAQALAAAARARGLSGPDPASLRSLT